MKKIKIQDGSLLHLRSVTDVSHLLQVNFLTHHSPESATRCLYIESVPEWYAFFGEQLRSAVLRVRPRRLTCRLSERLKKRIS